MNASRGALSPIVSAPGGGDRNLVRLPKPTGSGAFCYPPSRSAYAGVGAGAQAASNRIILSLSAPSGGCGRDLPEPAGADAGPDPS